MSAAAGSLRKRARDALWSRWRRQWIVEAGLPGTVRALALAALGTISMVLIVIALAPWLRRADELVHPVVGPKGGASPYAPMLALQVVPSLLALGLAYGLAAARFAGARVRLAVALVAIAGTGVLAAAMVWGPGHVALQLLPPWPARLVQTLLTVLLILLPLTLLLLPARRRWFGWGTTATLSMLAALPLAMGPSLIGRLYEAMRIPDPLGQPAAWLHTGMDNLALLLLIPFFLLSGAALHGPALSIASRTANWTAKAAGGRGPEATIPMSWATIALAAGLALLVGDRLRDGSALLGWGVGALAQAGMLVAIVGLGRRRPVELSGPQVATLVMVTVMGFFVVPALPGLVDLPRDPFQLAIGLVLALSGGLLLRTRQADLGVALMATGGLLATVALAYLSNGGRRPAGPLYQDVTMLLFAVMLLRLTLPRRRPVAEAGAEATWIMRAAFCLLLVTEGTALLDPAGAASGFTAAGILVTLWGLVSTARAWTVADRPWLPRASGVLLYFGFYLLVYAVIAWLQLQASPDAAEIQAFAGQGLRIFAVPLLALTLGSQLPATKVAAPATLGVDVEAAPGLAASTATGVPIGSWTVLVYIAGDNDLVLEAGSDLAEMQAVGSSDAVTVLVQLDRLTGGGSRRYRVERGRLHTFAWNLTDENLNFGSAATLADFVRWGIEEAPAQRCMLVIWNHGGGWQDVPADYQWQQVGFALGAGGYTGSALFAESLRDLAGLSEEDRAVALDQHAQDFLDNQELQQALASAGRRLDIIGFDACLMNMLEVAYQLRDVAGIMVGSQEDEPLAGWPYDRILRTLVDEPSIAPESLARAIVEQYRAAHAEPGSEAGDGAATTLAGGVAARRSLLEVPNQETWPGRGLTQSALALDACDTVVTALNALAETLIIGLDTERHRVDDARTAAQRFTNPAYVDLADLARLLTAGGTDAIGLAAQGLLAALGASATQAAAPGAGETGTMVLSNAAIGAGAAYAGGISVYMPAPGCMVAGYERLDLAQRTRWWDFLTRYAGAPVAHDTRGPTERSTDTGKDSSKESEGT
ncbi:MAG: clostripain-related cysteine peptidase [Anaerolineae bacterium]